MSLITLENASLAYGVTPLLDESTFTLHNKERLCLIGRNGAGKSTLLNVLSGKTHLDSGQVRKRSDLVIASLSQSLPESTDTPVYDFVASGLAELGDVLAKYHHLSQQFTTDNAPDLKEFERLQHIIEEKDGWSMDNRINQVLQQFQLDPDTSISSLSGGWKRRADLAKAVVQQPDILFLDEPTNHLDVESIEWLEGFVNDFNGTVVLITHDRHFMDKVATRILELDRGQLTSFPGNFTEYQKRKAEMLHAEEQANALFDKKLAQEEVWIRQGIKARRTRNEGRVRSLEAMRLECSKRLKQEGRAKFNIEDASKSGRLVAEFKNVNFSWDGNTPIIKDFNTILMRGDKIALIGPNGCGKSTLIQLILDKIQPTSGSIKRGTNLEVAYFDQHRQSIDLEKSVQDNVAEGRTEITLGSNSRHIVSYLQDFLFSPQRIRTPAKALSGGELNRLVLAQLFSKPSNLMILDEPTNDLDIETLELLEELVSDYKGTVILVSHDRSFVDNTVTSSFVFRENEPLLEIIGGYKDWLAYKSNILDKTVKEKVKSENESNFRTKSTNKSKKLSYKDQLQLDQLPDLISQLETDIEELQSTINETGFFDKEKAITDAVLLKLKVAEEKLESSFERWDELESLKESFKT